MIYWRFNRFFRKKIEYILRESGVRNLRKQIEKIYRKVAFKVNMNNSQTDLAAAPRQSDFTKADCLLMLVCRINNINKIYVHRKFQFYKTVPLKFESML